MEFVYEVDVGSTVCLPPIPDQFVSRVTVLAKDDYDAIMTACGMVMRPEVTMPTSAKIISVEL